MASIWWKRLRATLHCRPPPTNETRRTLFRMLNSHSLCAVKRIYYDIPGSRLPKRQQPNVSARCMTAIRVVAVRPNARRFAIQLRVEPFVLRQCAHSGSGGDGFQCSRHRSPYTFAASSSSQQPATIIISKLNVTPTRDTITNISTVSHL